VPNKSYFVTFIYFNQRHQRSNKLSHVSIAIMEGEKTSANYVTNMQLLSSYGYYSHCIPKNAPTSTLENLLKIFAHVTFRACPVFR